MKTARRAQAHTNKYQQEVSGLILIVFRWRVMVGRDKLGTATESDVRRAMDSPGLAGSALPEPRSYQPVSIPPLPLG